MPAFLRYFLPENIDFLRSFPNKRLILQLPVESRLQQSTENNKKKLAVTIAIFKNLVYLCKRKPMLIEKD